MSSSNIIQLHRIVSVSSEVAEQPADNLLKTGAYSKWICKPGEKQACVIIQLNGLTEIDHVDIGNEHSAFIEVLVARSANNPPIYQALIPASSFMSPSDSRSSKNANQVKMFKRAQLAPAALTQKWDLIKIVCTQPFNKQCSYGIAFVRLAAPDTQPTPQTALTNNQPQQFGAFSLKPVNSTALPLSAGAMFAARKLSQTQTSNQLPPSPVQQPDIAVGSTVVNKMDNGVKKAATVAQKDTVVKRKTSQDSTSSENSTKRHKPVNTTPAQKKDNSVGGEKKKAIDKAPKQNKPEEKTKAAVAAAGRATNGAQGNTNRAPFNKLLCGVTFVLSGYQNPLRAELRTKAMEMGAVYKPDWDARTCSHLICAFANTPKHKQVRGQGAVVTQHWILQCHKQRTRLHWRDFALDANEKNKPHTDQLILADDQVASSSTGQPAAGNSQSASRTSKRAVANHKQYNEQSDSDSDSNNTDEEVQRIKDGLPAKKAIKTAPTTTNVAPVPPAPSVGASASTVTPTEPTNPGLDADGLPVLPNFFDGLCFFCNSDVSADVVKSVKRFVVGFGGSLKQYMGPNINYVLTNNKWNPDFETALNISATVMFVRPEWVTQCAKMSKLVDLKEYIIKQGEK